MSTSGNPSLSAKTGTNSGQETWHITDLYKNYFQKSQTFLFPLLGIPRAALYRPLGVYAHWIDAPDMANQYKLAVLYGVDKTRESPEPEKKHLSWQEYVMGHLYVKADFDTYFDLSDGNRLLLFSLDSFSDDVDKFHQGRYSQFSSRAKSAIRAYFGVGTAAWAYVETFLNPEPHFAHYANLLEVPEAELRKIGELSNKPDINRETFRVRYAVPL